MTTRECAGKIQEFARMHPRAVTAIGTATGAALGFGLATSKVGVLFAVAVGVVFATTAGAVAGRIVGEVLSRQMEPEYIPAGG
jgi:outer membrane lipoprotein SlyB